MGGVDDAESDFAVVQTSDIDGHPDMRR